MQFCTITITIYEHKLPKLGDTDKGSDKEGKIRDSMQGYMTGLFYTSMVATE